MRTTRIELEQAVIRAARAWAAPARWDDLGLGNKVNDDLEAAVAALDAHLLALIDGSGVPHNGTDTSRKSAGLAEFTQGSTRMEIVGQLASVTPLAGAGYTDEQLERRLSRTHQTVSSARNWLVKAGWVTDSGVRRRNAGSKRDAIVWCLTPAAEAHLKGQ